jgi:hypothetical protein
MLWWKVERASTRPSSSVTVTHTGTPACAGGTHSQNLLNGTS